MCLASGTKTKEETQKSEVLNERIQFSLATSSSWHQQAKK